MMLPFLLAATIALAPVQPQAVDLGDAKLYVQSDADAQLVGVDLIVSAGTARQAAGQDGLAALAAQTLLFANVDGVRLADRIAADGGSIDYSVDPGVVRFAIEALPDTLPAVARDVARALATPDTSPATVDAARSAIGDRIADDEKNPIAVGIEMLGSSYYSGGAGQPPLGTTATQAAFTPADVAAFFSQHYRRGNAFATATGRIDDTTGNAVREILDAFPAGSEAAATIDVRPFGPSPKHVITHRDIGVPFVLVGFAAPSMGDPSFPAMLVLRALLQGIGTQNGSATPSAFERGIDVIYHYDVKPATFTVSINGSQLDPTAGLTVLETILKNASSKAFATDVIRSYKEAARGEWALEAVTLTDRAWQIGAAVSQGADPATAQSVAAAIDRVTPADVRALVKTYLQHYTVALVLPRGRS